MRAHSHTKTHTHMGATPQNEKKQRILGDPGEHNLKKKRLNLCNLVHSVLKSNKIWIYTGVPLEEKTETEIESQGLNF